LSRDEVSLFYLGVFAKTLAVTLSAAIIVGAK